MITIINTIFDTKMLWLIHSRKKTNKINRSIYVQIYQSILPYNLVIIFHIQQLNQFPYRYHMVYGDNKYNLSVIHSNRYQDPSDLYLGKKINQNIKSNRSKTHTHTDLCIITFRQYLSHTNTMFFIGNIWIIFKKFFRIRYWNRLNGKKFE